MLATVRKARPAARGAPSSDRLLASLTSITGRANGEALLSGSSEPVGRSLGCTNATGTSIELGVGNRVGFRTRAGVGAKVGSRVGAAVDLGVGLGVAAGAAVGLGVGFGTRARGDESGGSRHGVPLQPRGRPTCSPWSSSGTGSRPAPESIDVTIPSIRA